MFGSPKHLNAALYMTSKVRTECITLFERLTSHVVEN